MSLIENLSVLVVPRYLSAIVLIKQYYLGNILYIIINYINYIRMSTSMENYKLVQSWFKR